MDIVFLFNRNVPAKNIFTLLLTVVVLAMRRTKQVTFQYGVIIFPRLTVLSAGVLLLFSAAAWAKMSVTPPGRYGEELYTSNRHSPSFARNFEAHLRPFFESKLKGGTALRHLQQEQFPREADFLLLVSLWRSLSPEFKALYKLATQIPGTFDSYVSPGGHFEIYYIPLTRDTVNGVAITDTISCGMAGDWRPRRAISNGIPDYVDEAAWALDSSWAMEVDRFTFVAPIPYNDSIHTSSRYPVVITWQPYGMYGQTWPDIAPTGPKGYPSHFELRNNWNGDPWTDLGYEAHPENGIRVTCAHELFHGVQYAMTWNVYGLSLDNYPLAWIEGTAVLMEELGFDSINDYLQYSRKFFNDPGMSFFNYQTSEDRLYSNSLLVKYLYKKNGGIGLFRTIFFNNYAAAAPFYTNLRAVSLSSGSPWTPLLNRFHTASYYTGSRADTSLFFADAELMGQWTYQHDILYGTSSVTKAVNPYGMRIFSLTPDSADGDTADFRLQCSAANLDTVPNPSWSASCIVRRLTGRDTILPLAIDASGRATLRIPDWKLQYDMLLIVSNGAPTETRNATVYFMPGSGYDTLIIFPNPGRLHAKKFIRFEGSSIREIRIYSTDGALVAASTGNAFLRYGNGFMWQLVNGSGASVAPGCYTSVVIRNNRTNGGKETKRHKIMVFP
jgi:hypothetical protein